MVTELHFLNKKLTEWAEFPIVTKDDYIPSDLQLINDKWTYCPDFAQSLDACFKWLVPKLMRQTPVDLELVQLAQSSKYSCGLCNRKLTTKERDGEIDIYETANTPALALCKAIEKLSDMGKKRENETG